MPQKVGKKVGIHFYKNVPSEINLPLTGATVVSGRCRRRPLSSVITGKNTESVTINALTTPRGEVFMESYVHIVT